MMSSKGDDRSKRVSIKAVIDAYGEDEVVGNVHQSQQEDITEQNMMSIQAIVESICVNSSSVLHHQGDSDVHNSNDLECIEAVKALSSTPAEDPSDEECYINHHDFFPSIDDEHDDFYTD
jgi:hypothetical protein